jgi:hypothetical protein
MKDIRPPEPLERIGRTSGQARDLVIVPEHPG